MKKNIFKTDEFIKFEASQIEEHAVGVNVAYDSRDYDLCLEELYTLKNYVTDMIRVFESDKSTAKRNETVSKIKEFMSKKAEA